MSHLTARVVDSVFRNLILLFFGGGLHKQTLYFAEILIFHFSRVLLFFKGKKRNTDMAQRFLGPESFLGNGPQKQEQSSKTRYFSLNRDCLTVLVNNRVYIGILYSAYFPKIILPSKPFPKRVLKCKRNVVRFQDKTTP